MRAGFVVFYLVCLFETRFLCHKLVWNSLSAQTDPKITILHQPAEHWNNRHAMPYLVFIISFFNLIFENFIYDYSVYIISPFPSSSSHIPFTISQIYELFFNCDFFL